VISFEVLRYPLLQPAKTNILFSVSKCSLTNGKPLFKSLYIPLVQHKLIFLAKLHMPPTEKETGIANIDKIKK